MVGIASYVKSGKLLKHFLGFEEVWDGRVLVHADAGSIEGIFLRVAQLIQLRELAFECFDFGGAGLSLLYVGFYEGAHAGEISLRGEEVAGYCAYNHH